MTVDRPLEQLARMADLRSEAWLEARAGGSSAGAGRYGADGRGRWPMLALVIVAHVIGLAILASAVMRPARTPRPQPLRITLIPLERSPPPAAATPSPAAKPVATPQTPQPIIAATPVVPVVAAAPITVSAPAPVIAPPAPSPEPVAPAAAAPAPAPAPLIPPDGQAATLHNPAPVYPVEARRRRQQGTVRLRVTISPEGRVEEIAVARTSGFDLLDQAALDAVRHWKFVPGSRGGVPVEAVGSLAIPFRLV